MNIQLAVLRPRSAMEAVYVREVNPRASMTVPFVSKACMANIPVAMLGLGSVPGCSDGAVLSEGGCVRIIPVPYATPSQLRRSGPL